MLRRGFNKEPNWLRVAELMAAHLVSAVIVAVAIDVEGSGAINDALRMTVSRILTTLPSARLVYLNVLKFGRMTIDRSLDECEHNKHFDSSGQVRRLAELLCMCSRLLIRCRRFLDLHRLAALITC